MALTGAPTAQHTVPVSTLGAFLTNLQESVSAVAQAVYGRPTTSASIPRDIRDATALSASATYPSSFGVAMYGPPIDADQYDLFGELPGRLHTVLDEAVNKVLDIVDLSEGASSSNDLLTEQLAPLGPRALKHISALTAGLTDANVGARVTWRAHEGSVRRSNWTLPGVQRVRQLCEESEFTEAERITVTGWLGTASSFHGKVEIRTDNGDTIRANTDEELTGRLDLYFNKRVSAEVKVTRVVFAGGRERRLYSVLNIRKLQDDET
ncbi:hypothetical protein OHA09_21080 [Streptomyces longwoodensis]|uniref:hypothetical protein n=1 Tax=Streptomyces longwoodensis TaxID=68231 RepID=UPI002E81DAF8|nr:hypothetical protein [Streptomyces longwoodensis]WUC59402.1 hypothetical protein OHA09_21080 [Streptomyces longwoodensis]